MTHPAPAGSFGDLSPDEQKRIVLVGGQMVRMAQQYACAIIIARPPSKGNKVNSASGTLLLTEGHTFLLTAEHVLACFEARVAEEPDLTWQVGDLVFDPRGRVVFRDARLDVVALRIAAVESALIPNNVATAVAGWPPPPPSVGDYVLVSGYPGIDREHDGAKRIVFNAMSAMFQVTSVGDEHCVCQIVRESLVSFDGAAGPGIPPQGYPLGGMGGGPVLLVRPLSYPLIGIVSQFQESYDLLRIAPLAPVRL